MPPEDMSTINLSLSPIIYTFRPYDLKDFECRWLDQYSKFDLVTLKPAPTTNKADTSSNTCIADLTIVEILEVIEKVNFVIKNKNFDHIL